MKTNVENDNNEVERSILTFHLAYSNNIYIGACLDLRPIMNQSKFVENKGSKQTSSESLPRTILQMWLNFVTSYSHRL